MQSMHANKSCVHASHTYEHTYITCIHECMHYIHTWTRTYITYMHACMHACIHTYMHYTHRVALRSDMHTTMP